MALAHSIVVYKMRIMLTLQSMAADVKHRQRRGRHCRNVGHVLLRLRLPRLGGSLGGLGVRLGRPRSSVLFLLLLGPCPGMGLRLRVCMCMDCTVSTVPGTSRHSIVASHLP